MTVEALASERTRGKPGYAGAVCVRAKAQSRSFLKDLDLARAIAEICGGSSPSILAIRVAASGPTAACPILNLQGAKTVLRLPTGYLPISRQAGPESGLGRSLRIRQWQRDVV